MMVFKHPSRRSGILSRTSTRTSGRRSTQCSRPWKNPSFCPFYREPPPKSWYKGSPACQSSRQGWRILTRICPPGRTGKPYVLSQDNWLQISTVIQSWRQGTMPCSCGRAVVISGDVTFRTHKWLWKNPWNQPPHWMTVDWDGEPRQVSGSRCYQQCWTERRWGIRNCMMTSSSATS